MSNVGQRERISQSRIVQLFQSDLGYRSSDKAISDYTQGVFDGYDKDDVACLLKGRLKQAIAAVSAAM